MHFSFLHPFKINLREENTLVTLHDSPRNTSEGGEFLDDALRLEDLSFPSTEESVGAATPKDLL